MKWHTKPGSAGRWFVWSLVALAMMTISASRVEAAFARVGNLWDQYNASGEEGWGGISMVWPGGYWKEDLGGEDYAKASASYKGFLYGFQNFTVPPSDASWRMLPDETPGTSMPYYVVVRDIKNSPGINQLQLIAESVTVQYRSDPAAVTTNGVANNSPQAPDLPQDPNLAADVAIVSTYRNNAGLQTVRTVYAFANANHDDYHIWHYKFTNTGEYCCSGTLLAEGGDPNAQFDQTLSNFRFSHSFWFMDRAEGGRRIKASGENTGDNLNNYKGHNPTTYAPENVLSDTKEVVGSLYGMSLGSATDYGDLRIQYAWDGDAPTYPGEDSGDPELITGRMMSARMPGVATIHVDKAWNDPTDDPDQPQRSDYDNHNRMPQLLEANQPGAYEFLYKTMGPDGPLVAGGLNNRFQQDAIRAGVPYSSDATNPKFTGSETILGYGNWELPPGESVNLIEVAAVGGIPYEETVELGKRLRLSDDELAEQGLTRLTEQQRLAKFFSVEDSLFATVRRAQNVITRDVSTLAELDARLKTQDIYSPPNVATLDVSQGVGVVNLNWTYQTDRADEIDSVRVYRARGSRVGDFPFELLFSGPKSSTSYVDATGAVGIDYYYYVVTVNSAGVESSVHMARTEHGVGPSTTAATEINPEGVYVVPNPWNARYQTKTFQSAPGQPLPGFAETVVFYGLPARSQVIIYTLDGVQVKRIEHDADAGTEAWDLTADNGQKVVSGVYIYAVTSRYGVGHLDHGTAVGKLVIVR